MRQLSQLSRELGSRGVLDGFGGDQLFFSSSASLIADHLRFGRWGNFWWEWRNWRGSFREFARLALLPNMSPATTRWLGEVRGRPLAGFWDRGYPPWIVTSPAVEAELEPQFERRPDEGAAEFEAREGMCSSLMKRAVSWNVAFGLDEGVQLRAPLFDQRLVAFAASRPLSDRGRAGDGKRALRLAMKGLIPDSVLAARDRKTGTPGGYFRRQFQPRAIDEAIRLFGHGQSQLERLGLVDRELLLDAANEYGTKGVHIVGAILQFTLETERWLAVRERRP
jgi:asparagine synthetase B (glutamine-hydrolysing)